jgi:hypothetical protein
MFTPPNPRRPVTVYTRWANPLGHIKIFRRVLTECVFTDQGSTDALQTGNILNQSLLVMVFNQPGMVYIPRYEWHNTPDEELLAGKWTIDFSVSSGSFIVDREFDYEFPGIDGSGWYIGTTPGQSASLAARAEEAIFVTVSTAEPGAYRVTNRPEEHVAGVTPRSQHIFIRA